jgi:multiple antibiotic resistance protein
VIQEEPDTSIEGKGDMLSYLISMIVLINPFALFVYLVPVMQDISRPDFFKVLLKSTFISLLIYSVFSRFGEVIFSRILSIDFESFRIFGGIVILAMALVFIIQGKKSFITLKGSLDDLASEIAMPFLVGASTIAISILIGKNYSTVESILIIALALSVNFATISILVFIKEALPTPKLKTAFDMLMGYFLRINGFFVGAIGVDMTLQGIRHFLEGQ